MINATLTLDERELRVAFHALLAFADQVREVPRPLQMTSPLDIELLAVRFGNALKSVTEDTNKG